MACRATRSISRPSTSSSRRRPSWRRRSDERAGTVDVFARGQGDGGKARPEDGPRESRRVCRHAARAGQGRSRQIVVVTSDSRGSGKLGPFGQALPKQIVEVGIAEQNLVGIAAGLAAAGKKSFAVSPACFLTARALEQIKNDVCYSDVPAKIVGISAGVSYGALGSTHHSLHDLAALRAIHNITILVPADNFETREAVRAAAARRHIRSYIRFGKAPMYDLHAPDAKFEVGKAITLRDGNDVAFIATGETVVHCLLAAAQLAEAGTGLPRAEHAHGQAARRRRRPRAPAASAGPSSRSRNTRSTAAWARRVPPC